MVWWKIGSALRINQFVLISIPLIFMVCSSVLYTEIHLLFFTLSLLVLSLVALDDRRQGKWFLVGALSALVVLSRLDTIFAIGSLAILLLIYKRKLSILVITFSVFAADFLTGNVSFLKRMRSSNNAFRYLFDSAAQLDKPIKYVMVIGGLGDWSLVPVQISSALFILIRCVSQTTI